MLDWTAVIVAVIGIVPTTVGIIVVARQNQHSNVMLGAIDRAVNTKPEGQPTLAQDVAGLSDDMRQRQAAEAGES